MFLLGERNVRDNEKIPDIGCTFDMLPGWHRAFAKIGETDSGDGDSHSRGIAAHERMHVSFSSQ